MPIRLFLSLLTLFLISCDPSEEWGWTTRDALSSSNNPGWHPEHVTDGHAGTFWTTVSRGTTIGHKKLDRIPPVIAEKVRLVIEDARANPAIRHIGLYATLQPQMNTDTHR